MGAEEIMESTERAERPVLRRTFQAEVTAGEGRTADVRIVPYGEVARVSDGGPAYNEQWMPGVFNHQLKAANRVFANFEHQSGIAGVVGHGLELREAPDGFHGSFKLHDTADGDKTLMLIKEGILDGVSLEAFAVRTIKTAEGVMQRVKANLRAVAFCRNPAFTNAKVLAVRDEVVVEEQYLPTDLDPELVERCRRLGIRLPQRYLEDTPAQDTPAETGTPEDGTSSEANV